MGAGATGTHQRRQEPRELHVRHGRPVHPRPQNTVPGGGVVEGKGTVSEGSGQQGPQGVVRHRVDVGWVDGRGHHPGSQSTGLHGGGVPQVALGRVPGNRRHQEVPGCTPASFRHSNTGTSALAQAQTDACVWGAKRHTRVQDVVHAAAHTPQQQLAVKAARGQLHPGACPRFERDRGGKQGVFPQDFAQGARGEVYDAHRPRVVRGCKPVATGRHPDTVKQPSWGKGAIVHLPLYRH
jgi:hypothetical protein